MKPTPDPTGELRLRTTIALARHGLVATEHTIGAMVHLPGYSTIYRKETMGEGFEAGYMACEEARFWDAYHDLNGAVGRMQGLLTRMEIALTPEDDEEEEPEKATDCPD